MKKPRAFIYSPLRSGGGRIPLEVTCKRDSGGYPYLYVHAGKTDLFYGSGNLHLRGAKKLVAWLQQAIDWMEEEMQTYRKDIST